MDLELHTGAHLGRYRLVRELGRGSMGLVYLAEDTLLRQPLCIKVLHPSMAVHPEAIERFHREILLSRRISHKGVCRLYDLHTHGETRFITMEHAEGTSLHDVLKMEPQLPIAQVITIGRSICEALAAAHDVGIIHRDLKPGNIIMRSNHEVTLLDFGIATAVDLASSLTMPGMALGTRSYIAPEVWAGHPATARSDQFAVAVILYKCLTGHLPFPQKDAFLLDAMLANGAVPIHAHREDVPRSLEALVMRALSLDPSRRFDDARALGHAIEGAGGGFADDSTNTTLATPEGVSFDAMPANIPSSPWSDQTDPNALAPMPPTRPEAISATEEPRPPPGDVTTESGSWLVDGRRVGEPIVAKELPSRTLEVAPVATPSRSLPIVPLLGAFAVAAMVTAAILSAGSDGASPPSASLTTSRATDVAAAGSVDLVASAPVAPVASAPVASAPVAPVATPEVAAAAPPEAVAPVPVPVPVPAGASTSTSASTSKDVEPRVRSSASSRKGRGNDEASAYAASLSALSTEMAERGLRTGDDLELDRLRAFAGERARAKQYSQASAALADARARVKAIVIDRAFIDRKLKRFNDAFDRVTDATVRARVDDDAGRALSEMAASRFSAANRALNEGYVHMNEGRR